MNNNLLNTTKVLVIALALSAGLQYVVAQTWTAPTATPPADNAYAPLNVGGGTGQSKVSGLTIGTGVVDPAPALILPTGRLSVGAGTSPVEKADVGGRVRATGFCIAGTPDSCISAWPSGGGMPAGTENGQTIRRDNLGAWVASNAIYNNATNIGIGPDSGASAFSVANPPSQRLDVNGNARFRGQIYDSANSAGTAGQILTKNAVSNLPTWTTNSNVLPVGTSGQTLRHNGTTWVANSTIFNNGTSVGINTASPTAGVALDVNGQVRIRTGSANGKVLTSNATGVATWADTTIPSIVSTTSNQVCSLTPNKKYLAIVYGSASSNNGGNSETYVASATVNGVTASINIGNSHNGGAISIPVVATADGSGCLNATVSNFRNSNGAPVNGINGIAVVG